MATEPRSSSHGLADRAEPVDPSDVAAALSSLYDELGDSHGLIAAVAAESRLHPAAVRDALRDWVASIDEAALRRLVESASRPPAAKGRLLTLAPGNVPIVAAECLILGLLAGGHQTLALSTRASALPIALSAHVRRVVRDLDARLELVVWRRLSPSERRAHLTGCRRLVAYGTAETVEWLAGMISPGTAIVPHGPTVALAYLDPEGIDAHGLDTLLAGFASDVARWDQRGCRSPHALFVAGAFGTAIELAQRLALEALPAVARSWPIGSLTPAEVASGYLDGLTSRALGSVFAGEGGVVTVEENPTVLRPSPLGRHVRVIAVDGPDGAARLAATLPAPVATLGVAGADPGSVLPDVRPVERAAIGDLQRPRFDRLHDGRHRLDELREA